MSNAGASSEGNPQAENLKPVYLVTPAWRMLSEQILHLAQFGSSVQVICGATGAGKSTFLRLLRDSAADVDFFQVRVVEGQPPEVLFHAVLTQLGLRPSSHAGLGELIVALRSFTQSLAASERRAILAFDDADHLQASELAALVSVLQGGDDAGFGLHFLLLAEPGLAERIDELQLLDVAVHDVHLPAFAPGDVRSLLARAANMENKTVRLDDETVRDVWADSDGLPGRALALLPRCVVQPAAATEKKPRRSLPFLHIAALVLLVCVLGWAILVRNDGSPSDFEASGERKTPLLNEGRHPIPIQLNDRDSEARPQSRESQPHAPQPQSPYGREQRPAIESEPAQTDRPSIEDEPDARPLAAAASRASAEEGAAYQLAQDLEAARSQGTQATPASPGGQAMPGEPVRSVSDATRTGGSAEVVNEQALLRASEQQLLRLAGQGYVLQLMATGSLSTLVEFHAVQPNRQNLLIHRAERDGKLLYFLVEGFYADTDSARAAVTNLPAAQKTGGPWPKRVSAIQSEIRQLLED